MPEREKVIKGLECCIAEGSAPECEDCPYALPEDGTCERLDGMFKDALALLKAQEPRVMSAADVAACPNGTVLWVEERQGVTWNMFPLEVETSSTHPDTGTDYLFFITYHYIRKYECSEYNQTWRCWTSRPSNELRDATPWEKECSS